MAQTTVRRIRTTYQFHITGGDSQKLAQDGAILAKRGMHQWVTSLLVTLLIRHWLSLFSDWMGPDPPHHE